MGTLSERECKLNLHVQFGLPEGLERVLALAVDDAAALFPNQQGAIEGLAHATYRKWQDYVSGREALPSGEKLRANGEYARSLHLESIQDGYTVFNSSSQSDLIENGSPAWDFHKVLQTSKKVRRSKAGSLYLIIPFTHATPDTVIVGEASSTMPEDIYQEMRQKAQSFISGFSTDSGVRRNRYQWGGRLTERDLERLGYDPSDTKTQRMVGMVRFGKEVGHVTFRVLSEKNKPGSWLMPARKGQHVAQAVSDWLQESYERVMEVALELDAAHLKAMIDPRV